MVVGGLGDFLDIADTVIVMDNYEPVDATEKARAIVKEYPSMRVQEVIHELEEPMGRFWVSKSLHVSKPKVKVPSLDKLIYGKQEITFYGYDMIGTYSQLHLIGEIMKAIGEGRFGTLVAPHEIEKLLRHVWETGEWESLLEKLGSSRPYNLAIVRHLDVAVIINRYRRLQASV